MAGLLNSLNRIRLSRHGTEIAFKFFMLAADNVIKERDMMVSQEAKEIVGILMESSVYFELSLEERLYLIKRILSDSPTAAQGPA